MGNERERQLQAKLLKTKEELKLEREEVNSITRMKYEMVSSSVP